jgi:hypothetical protein
MVVEAQAAERPTRDVVWKFEADGTFVDGRACGEG